MCGIAGIVRIDGNQVHKPLLHEMLSLTQYRGPDEAGYTMLNRGRIALGQVRLSIIDVSTGLQPMFSTTGHTCIVFNGEIYEHAKLRAALEGEGHRFATRTDTEVILALYEQYGLDMFSRLNGEFAFIIWDERKQRLIAARDRHGIKPLFWHNDGKAIYFCSESKGILSIPGVRREMDPGYLTGAMFGAWPSNTSVFTGISAMRPGHMLLQDGDHPPVEKAYWSARYQDETEMSFEDAKEGVRHHLQQAVKRRLVADVPVCMYLSGGVDSSLVAAMATTHGQSLECFTLGFTDTIFDETERARRTAGFLGVPFEAVPCSVDDLVDNFQQALFHTETCIGNPGAIGKMILSKHVRRAGYKVALTGEGADELFAGYPYFKLELIQRLLLGNVKERLRGYRLWQRFKKAEHRSEGMLWSRDSPWKKIPQVYGYPSFLYTRACEMSKTIPSLLQPEIIKRGGLPDEHFRKNFPPDTFQGMHQTHASLRMTLNWLSGYVLINFADRLEMANSIEGRPAFLDVNLAEFAATIPGRHLIDLENLREKHVLYEAYATAIPQEVRQNHKHPFVSQSWRSLGKSARGAAMMGDLLTKSSIEAAGIFSYKQLSKLRALIAILPPRATLSRRLDTVMGVILSAQVLHKQFVDARPKAADFVPIRKVEPPRDASGPHQVPQ